MSDLSLKVNPSKMRGKDSATQKNYQSSVIETFKYLDRFKVVHSFKVNALLKYFPMMYEAVFAIFYQLLPWCC